MSENDALRFIARLDHDLALQAKVRAVAPGDLDALVGVAGAAGFAFDVNELRAAFRTDWKMRRRFYGAAGREAGREDA
jgi:predicted ribosomally synthesized peptide with nif11-like leader